MAVITECVRMDLWQQEWDVLVVPVNCVGTMGAGLALQAAIKVPGLKKHYALLCKNGTLKAGHVVSVSLDNKIYLLAATKGDWRGRSRWEDVVRCIDAVASHLASLSACTPNTLRVAYPPLGSGLGNVGIKMENRHAITPDEVRRAIRAKTQWVCGIDIQIY